MSGNNRIQMMMESSPEFRKFIEERNKEFENICPCCGRPFKRIKNELEPIAFKPVKVKGSAE